MFYRLHTLGVVTYIMISLVGCSSIDYVYNDTLIRQGIISDESSSKPNSKKKDVLDELFYIPKQLGAFKVKIPVYGNELNKEKLFLINRKGSQINAETKVFEDTKSKYYDRAYFSVGMDQSDNIGLQWRFEDDSRRYYEKAYFNVGANKKKQRLGIEFKMAF